MSIVIDLAQDEEMLVRAVAGKEGTDPTTYITNLIRRHLLQQKAKTRVPLSATDEVNVPARVGNLHPGNFRMSDDFDDPLSDEFWLGES